MRGRWLGWLLFVCACAPSSPSVAPARVERPIEKTPLDRVVILTIDGLRPVDCLRVPTLAALAQAGAFAAPPEGALSVMPAVTYPAHTSMVTGRTPAHHGITTNHAPDPSPDGVNKGGWRWYAEDIQGPTLWTLAHDKGLSTALVTWPVTVGAVATVRMPEFWRARTDDDMKLLRALTTPGIWERIEQTTPDFLARYHTGNVHDSASIDAALDILAHEAPALMLIHIWQTDSAQHKHGPDTPEALAAITHADQQVARLLAGLKRLPEWPRTALVVASDHGFVRVDQAINLEAVLAQAGLKGRLWLMTAGGSAYFYLHDPNDREAIVLGRAMLDALAQDPAHGVGRVLSSEDIVTQGGDPRAVLALEARPGTAVTKREGTELMVEYGGGTHGYSPERTEMRATLLFYGPRIEQTTLHGARLIDLAPTVAPWLGLALEGADGVPLPITLR